MSWEKDKDVIAQSFFELINFNNIELIGIIKSRVEDISPILPILKFILSRLETVTTLTIDNRLWDAEIVLRSAIETAVKYIFITTAADNNEKEQRIDEYWNSLGEINSIKLSDQAKKNLKYFGNSEIHRLAYLPLILPEDIEKVLREKWPKSVRQKVEQKWSFTEMINAISGQFNHKPLEMISVLSHGYRMSSHVMHGDETGVHIIEERQARSPDEQMKAHSGHYIRLLSDSLSICALIAIETMNFLNLHSKKQFFFSNMDNLKSIEELIHKYSGRVFDDKDYDKYRSEKT